ncbi:MAG: hypothetical protein WBG64_02010, partial [Thermoanaerobaculia bacterium]
LVISAGCGGGGGGGGGGGTPPTQPLPPTGPGINFSPAGSPGTNAVYLAQAGSSEPNILTLEIRANQVNNLYGVGFDLIFPNNLLQWSSGTTREGQFLSANGTVLTELLISNQPANTLVIGHSRLGAVAGVGGTGLLFSLRFVGVSDGQGSFQIQNGAGFDSQGNQIPGFVFLGGTVSVQVQ